MASREFSIGLSAHVAPIMGSIHAVPVPVHEDGPAPPPPPPVLPFVTISREAGAGGRTLGEKLLQRLRDRDGGGGDPQWNVWDREVVEKVAADLRLSARLVESLELSSRSWLEQLLGGLNSEDADDMKIFHRIAQTVRAVAQGGRAIIVGRGGVFITQAMPGGVHVRLFAPLEVRIARMMREDHMTHDEAARWVRDTDRRRDAFYARFFPRQQIKPEAFTVMVNTGVVDDDALAAGVAAMVPAFVPAATGGAGGHR